MTFDEWYSWHLKTTYRGGSFDLEMQFAWEAGFAAGRARTDERQTVGATASAPAPEMPIAEAVAILDAAGLSPLTPEEEAELDAMEAQEKPMLDFNNAGSPCPPQIYSYDPDNPPPSERK